MILRLVRVVVVPGVLGIEDARAKPGRVDAGHVAQCFGDRVAAPLDGCAVLRRSRFQAIGALEHSTPSLGEVIHDEAGAELGCVHALEEQQVALPFLPHLDGRHQAVAVEVTDGGRGHTRRRQRTRQATAEAYAGKRVGAFRVEFADETGHPTLGRDLRWLAGVPDIHAAEV